MKNSWQQLFRRLAAGCIVFGSLAWSSAVCYAQIAFDSAEDPVYADGWQAGDNGGFGFTAWNFDSGYWWQGVRYDYHPGIKEIDDGLQNGTQFSNPFNDIGKAWTIGAEQYQHPQGVRFSFPRVGRGFPALQPGQTLSVIVDNPLERKFFKGYFIRLNGGTGGVNGNICNQGQACSVGGTPVQQINLRHFDYFTYGRWQIADAGFQDTPLFISDTGAGGMQLDVTLTSASTYEMVMTPLANPSLAFTHAGTLANPGVPVDWFELQFFNDIASDTGSPPSIATDFYIRSMAILGDVVALPGDHDGDGKVDAADYVVWRKSPDAFGGQQGYDDWRTNFGLPGAAGGALTASAVPEPNSFVYIVLTGAALLMLGLQRSPQAVAAEARLPEPPRK